MTQIDIHALAHITGGGLVENLPRVLPQGLGAQLDAASWELPEIFEWLRVEGNIAWEELYRTFNCGIGMAMCVAEADADRAIAALVDAGENAVAIGRVSSGVQGTVIAR
jgi:phosphoribosylformylglycinamidine cyclo-ligase